MAAAGQFLVPTLSGYYWMAGLGETVDPSAGPDAAAADPDAPHGDPGMPPVLTDLAHHNLTEGAASMRAARQAGVKIALGSDVSLATGLEIERMVHHGLTPAQALAAATGTAAAALGLAEHVGTVAAGKLADLIAVDGDPLAEPALLSDPGRIWLVWQQGVPVAGQNLYNERRR
jgi:imidazolonepropionase-like amidohydrolase